MTHPTTVHVTAEHIKAGERGSPLNCAVALALQAAFPDATEIVVGPSDFEMEDTRRMITPCLDLPLEAQEFIKAFDGDGPVEPFTFTVDYPEAAA